MPCTLLKPPVCGTHGTATMSLLSGASLPGLTPAFPPQYEFLMDMTAPEV
jgi:hypothetical protein